MLEIDHIKRLLQPLLQAMQPKDNGSIICEKVLTTFEQCWQTIITTAFPKSIDEAFVGGE